ncbi:helix-turn-helix domain-containing protein [Pukyongiella litopenaei]|nr:AraC family transcriptional regulator [Pukyongiella litopenaei]AVO37945.1 helix-turn-helix transcriptional regulator [Pukyongiella litopenaei]
MTAITFAIAVDAVVESFGKAWIDKLKSNVLSTIFRDPLVEATMMDMGHARPGVVSDAGLVHAAHMVTHQLLDQPSDIGMAPVGGVIPLGKATLDRLQTMLDGNLERQVSVTEMAEFAGVSRHHFSRRFKAATGRSPLQFAIMRRLAHAAELLEQEQTCNILSVAQRVGFDNPSHFARTFRQHFGVSPRRWKTEQMRTQSG